jgi:hypothetical protein
MGLVFIINLLPHGHQTSHVPNSSHSIEPHSSHCPFALSCTTADLSSILSSMQTTNHPLITLPIPTNHTPPTSSPYHPPTFHVNVGSQPYTFPNPLHHAQLGHFFPSHSIGPYSWPWSYPPTYSHFFNTPSTSTSNLVPHMWALIYKLKVNSSLTLLSNI